MVAESLPVRERGLKLSLCQREGPLRWVAPRAGAWVETGSGAPEDWLVPVAPRAGAWVETTWLTSTSTCWRVAPRAGAWVETVVGTILRWDVGGRSPCGSVG